jgi:hypothetical protein
VLRAPGKSDISSETLIFLRLKGLIFVGKLEMVIASFMPS